MTGFVELGGLIPFNTLLKKNVYSQEILNILVHDMFPFSFSSIESSGLGQTVFDLTQKDSSPYCSTAKRVFQNWKQKNKELQAAEQGRRRTTRIKFKNIVDNR
eukprot:UN04854